MFESKWSQNASKTNRPPALPEEPNHPRTQSACHQALSPGPPAPLQAIPAQAPGVKPLSVPLVAFVIAGLLILTGVAWAILHEMRG